MVLIRVVLIIMLQKYVMASKNVHQYVRLVERSHHAHHMCLLCQTPNGDN
jgi:hypothetical protein